jgi:hypothetical protein
MDGLRQTASQRISLTLGMRQLLAKKNTQQTGSSRKNLARDKALVAEMMRICYQTSWSACRQ